jgi:hypothetical protein
MSRDICELCPELRHPLGHDPFVHAWPGWALALTRHHECEGIYEESGRRLRMRDGGAVSSGSGRQ